MDIFLKRMEPEIEHVTGEERDTNTFMRIMRMFNSVRLLKIKMRIYFFNFNFKKIKGLIKATRNGS